MEESTYKKEYLSPQGPKWIFFYDLKDNSGNLTECENGNSFPFKLHYNKFNLTTDIGKERYNNLSELEFKWVDNCVSEILFIKKGKQ